MPGGPDAIVTAKMADALLLIDEVGPLAQSNKTDDLAEEGPPTIHATTAQHLDKAGLVIPLGFDEQHRQLWALSPEGERFVERRKQAPR